MLKLALLLFAIFATSANAFLDKMCIAMARAENDLLRQKIEVIYNVKSVTDSITQQRDRVVNTFKGIVQKYGDEVQEHPKCAPIYDRLVKKLETIHTILGSCDKDYLSGKQRELEKVDNFNRQIDQCAKPFNFLCITSIKSRIFMEFLSLTKKTMIEITQYPACIIREKYSDIQKTGNYLLSELTECIKREPKGTDYVSSTNTLDSFKRQSGGYHERTNADYDKKWIISSTETVESSKHNYGGKPNWGDSKVDYGKLWNMDISIENDL